MLIYQVLHRSRELVGLLEVLLQRLLKHLFLHLLLRLLVLAAALLTLWATRSQEVLLAWSLARTSYRSRLASL